MNTFVIILLVAAGIIFLLILIAGFTSDKYTITQKIIINKPVHQVFDYIRYMKNASYYNKWMLTDPEINIEYSGVDGLEGFVAAWEGKKSGKGEQEITKIKEGERIDYEIRFEKPFKGISYTCMSTEARSEDKTLVYWSFSGKRNLMLKILQLLFNLKKVMGKDLATSLKNLKTLLEK